MLKGLFKFLRFSFPDDLFKYLFDPEIVKIPVACTISWEISEFDEILRAQCTKITQMFQILIKNNSYLSNSQSTTPY